MINYFLRIWKQHQHYRQACLRDPSKAYRAKHLLQMDRNLTPEEWAEAKRLIAEGF